MFKKNKLIVSLVAATLLLSSSIAYGEVGRIQKVNYKYKVPSYTYNWNWSFGTRPNTPVKPEKPVKPERPVKPEKPVTPPATKPDTPNGDVQGLSAMEMEVVRLVNIERQKAGLGSLTASSQLSKVARTKSEDMAKNNYFSHTSPTYGDPFTMMRSFGISYGTAAENIAKGYYSAQSVVKGWMNSSGHRANILNGRFNKIGVGAYETNNGTIYWTQMFTD